MADLTSLGFSKGAIVETIVSTYGTDGKPNAAPMGAKLDAEGRIVIRLFNTSQTLKNLLSTRCAVINVTSDIEAFYRTAFKEANPEGAVPESWFEKARTVNAPLLRSAEASIEALVFGTMPADAQRTEATFTVSHITALRSPPKAHNRAFAATLEAIIHTTRVQAFAKDKGKQKQVAMLVDRIAECSEVVNRTAPHSRYAKIMADLDAKVTQWRIQK